MKTLSVCPDCPEPAANIDWWWLVHVKTVRLVVRVCILTCVPASAGDMTGHLSWHQWSGSHTWSPDINSQSWGPPPPPPLRLKSVPIFPASQVHNKHQKPNSSVLFPDFVFTKCINLVHVSRISTKCFQIRKRLKYRWPCSRVQRTECHTIMPVEGVHGPV